MSEIFPLLDFLEFVIL